MELKIYKELLLLALIFSINFSDCHLHEISNEDEVKQPHNEESHLLRHLSPNTYSIRLTPRFDQEKFNGRVVINMSCHEPTDTITLHVHKELEAEPLGFTVRSAGTFQNISDKSLLEKLCQSHYDSSMEECDLSHSIQISGHEIHKDEDLFVITLEQKMIKGFNYCLSLNFRGHINMTHREGFYHRNYKVSGLEGERWFAVVNLDKKNARKVFPCFDDPYFKARIKLTLGLNRSLSALSTMPLQADNPLKYIPGMTLARFELSPPMALGSFGIFIFDPTHIKPLKTGMTDNVIVRGFGDPKLTTAFYSKMEDVVARLTVLNKKLGLDFPLPVLNLVALPLEENDDFWGLLTFSENQLLYQSLDCPMFYLLPKQWIGHMVTPEPQSTALNDGLKVYLAFASLKVSEKEDEIIYADLWPSLLAPQLYDMMSDKKWSNILQNAWMWRMLNYTLTEQTFKFGIYNFLHFRAFKMYNEADVYMALDNQAWLHSILPQDKSVEVIAKSWNEKLTFPIVTVTRNYEQLSASIWQHPFIPTNCQNETDELNQHLFWIPITYMEGNLCFSTGNSVTWMREKQMVIKNLRDASTYIIVNPEQIGMFVVNYDPLNWGLLSRHLLISGTSENSAPLLPKITRSKLLFDAMFLALNKELDFGTALNMTLFLKCEKSPTLWMIMNDIMQRLERKLHDSPVYDKFLIYARFLYATAYEHFKNKEVKGFLESLNIKNMAADVGYEPAVDNAKTYFRAAPRNSSWLEHRFSCAVLRWSDEDWEQALEYTLSTIPTNESSDVNYFASLVWCTRRPENLIRILHLVFVDSKYTFSNKDVKNILYAIHNYPVLLRFILDHWNEVKTRCGDNLELWNFLFEEATKDIKNEEGLQLLLQLYRDHQNDLGSAKGIVEKSMITEDDFSRKYLYVSEINKWLDSWEKNLF